LDDPKIVIVKMGHRKPDLAQRSGDGVEHKSDRFDMNDLRYPEPDSIRATRQFWVNVGGHPPDGDIVLG
jgi:hypothetical protein